MRLGFAVKVLGRPGLKSNDARRWQNNPHLRVSIEYAHHVFDYLEEVGISMYRFSSDFAPYLTHPDLPQFHQQLAEAGGELVALGRRANELNLRLSFHPSQYILLNSPSERLTEVSTRDFMAQATMLDMMEQGPEAVIVTHVGGVYGDKPSAIQRFVENYRKLPEPARRRLVLENDDESYGTVECLQIHEQCGVRLIFDHQHYTCINDGTMTHAEAACAALSTWPSGVRPKIHFSSPRQALRTIERRNKATGERKIFEVDPLLSQHADYIDSATFIPWACEVTARCGKDGVVPFDVMCEAKAKDLAVFQLRDDLLRDAPDLQLVPMPSAIQLAASHRFRQELTAAERAVQEAKDERVRVAAERKAEKERSVAERAAKKIEKEKAAQKAAKAKVKLKVKTEKMASAGS